MNNRIKKSGLLEIVLGSFILILVGMECAGAAMETVSNTDLHSHGQWPMAVWYALSVLLALIGYVTAKSRD